jgi:hypothetical protein
MADDPNHSSIARAGTDPVLLAIERHRRADQIVQQAARRLARLEDRLPSDVRRTPRVQVGICRKRGGGTEPTYAHFRDEIDRYLARWEVVRSKEILNARRTELYDALEADAAALAEAQAKCGLTAAREQFERASAAGNEALHGLVSTIPATAAGASALAGHLARYLDSADSRLAAKSSDGVTLATVQTALLSLAKVASSAA